jgi:hypothetical protein
MQPAVGTPCPICTPHRTTPRHPTRPNVCDPCRSWLTNTTRAIPNLHQTLQNTNPTHAALAANHGTRVTGTTEGHAPTNVDILDLTATARVPNPVAGWDNDQIGNLPIASTLDSWVRDWANQRGKREKLPIPTVAELCAWLTPRIEDACDNHTAIAEFAEDLRALRATLMRINGLVDIPDYKKGITCPSCEYLALIRRNGSDWIECDNCNRLLTADEYTEWVETLADQQRTSRASEPGDTAEPPLAA